MFTVDKITGFQGIAPIIIKDAKGRDFYIKQNSKYRDGSVCFNLPRGQYSTSNDLLRLPRPIRYNCPKLPIPERHLALPELRIEIKPNPHKCTVYFKTGRIVLDPSMAEMPRPNLQHILFHELGHFLYKTEWKCDMFSCYNMLKFGYNPSQCLKVMMHNLSSNKMETVKRAERNANYLKRVNYTL